LHHQLRADGAKAHVVDAWAPLRLVLGDAITADQAEDRLFSFVLPFVEAVS
jgi:hypothetical protein